MSTPGQLAAIDDTTACLGMVYVQDRRIDLSGQWTPLGSVTNSSTPFTGVYYGNCQVIDGIRVGSSGAPFTGDAGMFLEAEGATYARIVLTDLYVNTSSDYAGGLASVMGWSVGSSVREVSVSGDVIGLSEAGLIAGEAYNSSLERIDVSGQVETTHPNPSYAAGTQAGGMVGNGYTLNVAESASSAAVTGPGRVGGALGTTSGFVVATNVMATGAITSSATAGAPGIGGLIGETNDDTITTSYARGLVEPGSGGVGGGLVGNVSLPGPTTTYMNAFWDKDTTGQLGTAVEQDDTTTTGAKTTAEMKTPSTFASWDPAIWKITNGSYPTLQWLEAGGVAATCPKIATVSPSSAQAGAMVTIAGSGFTGATAVTFGSAVTTDVVVIDDTTMTARVPAGTGSVAVSFTPVFPVIIGGIDDTMTLPVASKASAFTYGGDPTPTPPAPQLDPPSEPRDVQAVAVDRRATVSWTAPAYTGSGPVMGYQVTSSPGGKTCATVAPTVSCTVSGLDNGTTYTFTVRAQNDYGSSLPSAASNPVTPQAESPTPVPVPPVPSGGSSLLVDGQPTPGLSVAPNARQDGLDITGPGFTMTLSGLDPDGKALPLTDDSVLQVIPGAQADAGGTGFSAGTEVGIFLDPTPLVRSAMSGLVQRALGASSPITLGTLKVKADSTFAGTLPIPADLPLGSHVLQAVGYSPSGQTRAVSIGVLAIAPKTPSIVVTGTRDGRTVKVRGATQGLTSSTVVPRYHFAGQVKYKTGVARPTIDTSGNFTWSRKTGRTIYLYFAADGIRSNRLVLRRVV